MTTLPGPWQGRGSPHHPWPVLAPPQGVWTADDECGSVGGRGREIPTMPSAVLQQKGTHTVESCNYLKMWHVDNTHTRSTFDHVFTYCKSEEVWCLMAVELSIERLCQEPISELWTLKKKDWRQVVNSAVILRMKFLLHAPTQTKCELKTAPERTFNLKYLDH